MVGLARDGLADPGERSIGSVGFDVSTLLYFALAVIVGLQAIYFFLTARWFGITEGLLPDDPLIRRMVERPRRLEWALLVGMLLVAVGVGLSLYAVSTWNERRLRAAELPRHASHRHPGSDADRLRHADGIVRALPRRARAAASVRDPGRMATSVEQQRRPELGGRQAGSRPPLDLGLASEA